MNQITPEALEFVKEAKKGFTEDGELTTYRDEEESFIALRGGFREDCMTVYELGKPIGNFVEQLPRQHKVLVDYEDYEQMKELKKIRQFAEDELYNTKGTLYYNPDSPYHTGYANAVTTLLNFMTKSRV